MRRRIAALGMGAVVAVATLTGCSSDDGGTAAPSSTTDGLGEVTVAPDGVQEVTVETRDDYEFYPATFTVAPGQVRLTVVNAARQMTHNLVFDEGAGPEPITAKVDYLGPGQEKTIEFEVTEPGEQPFSCTFHVQLGQVGTMTVSS